MLTTAITGAITALLALFGIQPSAAMIAGIWIFVKVVVVMGIFGLASKWYKARQAQQAEQLAAAPVAEAARPDQG